jgi:nucleotide-binding universal stress UspA family protein
MVAASTQSASGVPADAGLWLSRGIIVGVDGSESSVEALQRALRLGALAQTTVRAIAVWQPVPFGQWGTSVYKPAKDAAAILTTAVGRVCGDEVPEWFTAMAKQGSAANVLIEASTTADLLIVGTRGRAKVTGLLLGSVSSECLGRASCPVLVVNANDSHGPTK